MEGKLVKFEGDIEPWLDWEKEVFPTYDSPLTIAQKQFCEQLDTECENQIMNVAKEIGIHVDREKLIQILMEDKRRYEEAWMRGYKTAKAEIENESEKEYE